MIIDFEKARSKLTPERSQRLEERERKLRDEGNDALQALKSWRRTMHGDDRIQLSINFDAIYSENKLKPRDFDWSAVSESPNSFRNYLSKIRSKDAKKTPARSYIWIMYIELLLATLKKGNAGVVPELLYHRITRGTRFHPSIQHGNEEDNRLIYGYELLTAKIDEDYGLLSTYKAIAEAACENNMAVIRNGIGKMLILDDCDGDQMRASISSDINVDYLAEKGWEHKSYIHLSNAELDELVSDINSSGDANDLWYVKECIENYHRCTSVDRIMYYDDPYPTLLLEDGHNLLPNCFLGFNFTGYEGSNYLKDMIDKAFDENGNAVSSDTELMCQLILVLYPDKSMSKLEPWLITYDDFWPEGEPLRDMVLRNGATLCISSSQERGTSIKTCTLNQLLSETDRITESLLSTAKNLKRHPIIKRLDDEKQAVRDAANRLFDLIQ